MGKAEKTLPNGPKKRNAVTSRLAKKFQLQIMLQTNNRGGPKQQLGMNEISWLHDFLDHPHYYLYNTW